MRTCSSTRADDKGDERRATSDERRADQARPQPTGRRQIAHLRHNIPGWIADELATEIDERVREVAARHPGLGSASVAALFDHTSARVRAAALARSDTQADVLAKMTSDSDADVRFAVADHPQTTAATLDVLARDKNVSVRQAVAEHPKISAKSAALLAGQQEDVARSVESRPKLSKRAHQALTWSQHFRPRAIAAARPATFPRPR